MNYLEKLLDGIDVEWKELGEVIEVKRGKRLVKSQLEKFGDYAVYQNSMTPLGYYHETNVQFDTTFIIGAGAAGEIGYSDIDFWAADDVYFFAKSEIFESKFLYHFLLMQQHKILSQVRRASIPRLSRNSIEKIQVPIPSLKVQNEIVRILDKFTTLTAELTAELIARKQQYAYYREQLFTFKDSQVEWKILGEVTSKWYSGGTPKAGNPEYYEGGNIPWLRTQEVKFNDIEETNIKVTPSALENSSAKWIPKNCVIIAISGATAGRSAINKIPLTTNQHCGCLEIDSAKALYRYVFHWVSFNYENIKALGQGARGDLNSSIIKNFKIPIPPLPEQQRIVDILDKFDALTTSLTEGLPREIELRQQQYEYYRELLLSFPQPESGTATS